MKKLLLMSGGQDSIAVAIDYYHKFGAENLVSLGIYYGQKHFEAENLAAEKFCKEYNIKRNVIKIPINQINVGRCLTDSDIKIPDNMDNQKDTVVNFRNAIFTLFAAGIAIQENCNEIVLGVNIDDYQNYRDCRPVFFEFLEMLIQAGHTKPLVGSDDILDDINKFGELDRDKIDIKIITPLINESKRETVKRIAEKYGIAVYKNSWSCYNGGLGDYKGKPCLKCPACRERIDSFEYNGYSDPAI